MLTESHRSACDTDIAPLKPISQLLFLFHIVAKYKGEILCSVCDKSDSTDENDVVVCDSCFHGNFKKRKILASCNKSANYLLSVAKPARQFGHAMQI